MLAYDPEQRYEVEEYDVEYRRDGDESWLATIYQPKGAGPFPALLFVHGGAWSSANRTGAKGTRSQALVTSGVVVAAIHLRLAPQHPYPAQIMDVNYATRWLKVHAHEFHADPSFVGATGGSSGGHTVMLSALRPADPRYVALPLDSNTDASLAYVLAHAPIMDPYARFLYAKDAGIERLANASKAYFLTEEAMQEANPQQILDRGESVELPPILVIQGTADENIPISVTERFVASYRHAGGEAQLEMFPDLPHNPANWPIRANDHALALMKAFIARQLASLATPVAGSARA